MSGALPYRRLAQEAAPSPDPTLDLALLRELWTPWLTLRDDDGSHPLARNVAWIWNNAHAYPDDHLYARPWTSLTAAGGLRSLVLRQCRHVDLLDQAPDPAADSGQDGAEFARFLAEVPEWLEAGGMRRLQAVAALNALTATAGFPDLEVPTLDGHDPIAAHTAYEIARGLRARNPFDEVGRAAMTEVAHLDVDPRLALLAVVNLMTLLLRFENDIAGAEALLPRGTQLVNVLGEEDSWLASHATNHFHRICALLRSRQGDYVTARDDLAAADVADARAAELAADPYAAHVTGQGHALLVGVKVRFETRTTGDPANVRPEVEELMRVAPHDFEQQPAIGDLLAGAGAHREAGARYLAGAQGGSVHGAIAAFRGYEQFVEAGATVDAERALGILADLDATADVQSYR